MASTGNDFRRMPGAQLWAVPQKCAKACLLTTHVSNHEEGDEQTDSRDKQTVQGTPGVEGGYRHQCKCLPQRPGEKVNCETSY